jgi:hypothetical protein
MKYIKTFEDVNPLFNIGDIVKCIDNLGSNCLKMDELYTIIDIKIESGDCVLYRIEGAPTNAYYFEERFIRATEAEITANKYNL